MLFTVKHILSCLCVGKDKVAAVKTIDFSMKIGPKITCKLCRKFLFFYFMLEMYLLTLVSVEDAWERFRGPTDSKNYQKHTSFRKIHYNRVFNTNEHLLTSIISASIWIALEERGKNDLLQKVFTPRRCPSYTM